MKKLSIVALAVLGLAASNIASAETDRIGAYVGGQIGAFSADVEGDSESGQSYGAYGGYNFNEWFGLEGTLYITNNFVDEDFVDVYAASFSVAPKFTWVINDTFSLYGKVGVASVAVIMDGVFRDVDYTGVGLTAGAGVNAALTNNLNIRLGYDYTSADLDSDDFGASDFDIDLSNVTLGMHYQF
ncbi:porin family protein [Shewanella sp. Choline-02u-19]|jgi:opacity protein-like surface antigen|uniref:porin family protein n=1 Tax=unclassified Shewanella TaxID=196818 RepID=UPI000C34B2E4|nr:MULTISPECIES: porin family protein [unclassified Shewanella]PKG55453.1 porin family protein [Shewanella sp. GutDb-MelDb]PKG75354.1 porin family protein [Shewanella sp. GutCb]PKH59364.1 porin family protein [Shewanella sp. Bg11-22]PKI29250.1 porin family protein [Shewanella sp. Choline-02u-19]